MVRRMPPVMIMSTTQGAPQRDDQVVHGEGTLQKFMQHAKAHENESDREVEPESPKRIPQVGFVPRIFARNLGLDAPRQIFERQVFERQAFERKTRERQVFKRKTHRLPSGNRRSGRGHRRRSRYGDAAGASDPMFFEHYLFRIACHIGIPPKPVKTGHRQFSSGGFVLSSPWRDTLASPGMASKTRVVSSS
jgi:hypothetical protein